MCGGLVPATTCIKLTHVIRRGAVMGQITFRVLQVVMPFVGLWIGLRTYAWLSKHPTVYDPISGAICAGMIVWLIGGALAVTVSEEVGEAYRDARHSRTRPAFYAMLISVASLVISGLTFLTK